MTVRLTSSSLAGTSRKLVAVGTSRLASMLATMRAAAPRNRAASGGTCFSAAGWAFGASGASFLVVCAVPLPLLPVTAVAGESPFTDGRKTGLASAPLTGMLDAANEVVAPVRVAGDGSPPGR